MCKRCFICLKKGLKEAMKCVDLQQSKVSPRSSKLGFLEVLVFVGLSGSQTEGVAFLA